MKQEWPELGAWLEHNWGLTSEQIRLETLPPGASARRYVRVRPVLAWPPAFLKAAQDQPTVLAMLWPMQRTGTAVDFDPEPYLEVQRFLHAMGVRVPSVYHVDLQARVMLIEDLGDMTLESKIKEAPEEQWPIVYRAAIDVLATLHNAAQGAVLPTVVASRVMTQDRLREELDHFLEWGTVPVGAIAAHERNAIDQYFDRLAHEVAGFATGFVHRDFQSRNLMMTQVKAPVVIDFQDALMGPALYDVVALLCDSYIAFAQPLQEELLEYYLNARGLKGEARIEARHSFWSIAVQRKLKDAGRFVFLDKVRGQPEFMQWYPQSLVYVLRALSRVEGEPALRTLLEKALDAS